MDDLTRLMHDAVDDVEPTDRLAELRHRTETPRRPRWLAVGATTLAVAAVVTAVAVVGQRPEPGPGPGPAAPDSTATDAPAPLPSTSAQTVAPDRAVAVYYVGDTPDGPRLFRELRRVEVTLDDAALVSLPPEDPDYRTDWRPDAVTSVSVVNGTVEVVVTTVPAADLELQQLVYTVTGALGENLPVQLVADGEPVLDPLTREPRVLAPVNISDPGEGRVVEDHFGARGAVRGAGEVGWELRDEAGAAVLSGPADRTDAEWTTPDIEVSGLAPGRYTLAVSLDGSAGGAAPSDTRTVVVE